MIARFVSSILSLSLALMPSLLCGGEPARRDRYGDPLPENAIARLGTARLRVDQHVRAFAFWPDDKTLAACCSDGSIRFWERSTGRECRRLQTPLSYLHAAVFIPKTKAIAILGGEGKFILWDTAGEKTNWTVSLPDFDRREGCLVASPDGKLLAVPEQEGKVSLYETASGRKLRSLEEAEVQTLVFSPDSTLVAIASRKPPVHLWDVRSGKKLRDVPSPKAFPSKAIAFARDGKRIAVARFGQCVVSETATGKEVTRFEIRRETYAEITQGGLLFSADGKTLITGHYREAIHFWDADTGKRRFSRETRRQQGAWPVLSQDGKVLAEADQDGRGYRFIHLLDPATGKEVGPPAEGHEYDLNFIAFSSDGKILLSGDQRTIRQWTTATGEPVRQIQGGYFDNNIALSIDRKLLARPWINQVELWDPDRDKPVRSLKYKGKDLMRAVAFSPDGKYLLSAHNKCSPEQEEKEGKFEGQDGLHFWDLASGKEIHHSFTPAADLYSVLLITPDGRLAIAGSVKGRVSHDEGSASAMTSSEGAGQLYLWHLPNGRAIRTLEGHRGAIRSLALSGDGRLLASGSDDQTVRLWELISGKTLFTFSMAKTYPQIVALSPDGRLLATGTGPARAQPFTICLWSTATGKPVLELRGHNSDVRCLAFSPDNQRLASGLSDGTALVWDVSTACRAVRPEARRLAAKERETLWTQLADSDALKAQRALWTLIAGGKDAVAMLKGRLRPAERVDPKRLQKLLADLDADEFAVREAASSQLMELGEQVETALETALTNRPSLEVCKRIEYLLVRARSRQWSLGQLRAMRAVRVLEQIGSVEARDALLALAKGNADALLTQEVKASLTRLMPQSSKPERGP
jgi:WD40 repeat protein